MMNILIKLVITCLFFLSVHDLFSQKLIEKWNATQKKDKFTFIIFEDSSCMLVKNNDTLISNNYLFDNGPSKSIVSTDTSQAPYQIDLKMIATQLNYCFLTYKGIFEKLDNDKMRLRLNFGLGERPKSFMPLGNNQTLIFIREL